VVTFSSRHSSFRCRCCRRRCSSSCASVLVGSVLAVTFTVTAQFLVDTFTAVALEIADLTSYTNKHLHVVQDGAQRRSLLYRGLRAKYLFAIQTKCLQLLVLRAAVSVFIGPCCPALLESYLRKCAYCCIIEQIKWWNTNWLRCIVFSAATLIISLTKPVTEKVFTSKDIFSLMHVGGPQANSLSCQ